MGGKRSLDKGKRGEREIIKLLQPIVEEECSLIKKESTLLQRNLLQSDIGGADLHGLDWLSIEVKFQETLQLKQWWEQTLRQTKSHQIPVLFYRKSRTPWRVRLYGDFKACGINLTYPADIELESFLSYFRLLLKSFL